MSVLKFFLEILLLSRWVGFKPSSCSHLEQTATSEWYPPYSFLFRACQNMVDRSDQKLLYAVELSSDPLLLHLIQHLHQTHIQTIVISDSGKLTRSVSHHVKNMIFNVNDFDELLSFILDSASQQEPIGINIINSTDSADRRTDREPPVKSFFSRSCIRVDTYFLWSGEGKTCDKTIDISSAELMDSSLPSDSVFNATRGLYVNKIWNSQNNLIFFLKNLCRNCSKPNAEPLRNAKYRQFANEIIGNRKMDLFDTMIFCFRFFWRFFRGQKTIICHPRGCEKYDPFTENLISFTDENDENFFDFSWINMHRKPMKVYIEYPRSGGLREVELVSWERLKLFHEIAVENLAKSVNCSPNFDVIGGSAVYEYYSEEEADLRYGVDLHLFGTRVNVSGSDLEKTDFFVSVGAGAICIAVPHSGFMSQGLVIFKSFTPIVWIFTLITIFIFSLFQYFLQYSQCELFNRLYSEAQRDDFRGTSSILIVYAYFVCGSPPSLNSGHLATGKILFSIFSFSTLIISTAFLSSMTTLLSNRVLYPEIDSLRTLDESDLLIETFNNPEVDSSFFENHDCSESLKAKLVNNYVFYIKELYKTTFPMAIALTNMSEVRRNFSITDEFVFNNWWVNISNVILSQFTSNAFLVGLPFMSNPRKNILIKLRINAEALDYHLVKECLMMYPLALSTPKNSFLYDKLNRVIAHLLETGHANRVLEDTSGDFVRWENSSATEEDGEPRAYDINDLQSAFIALIIGLFLSFLTFVGELLIDFFRNFFHVNFLRRINILRTRQVSNAWPF
ncbi:unnamed protein product [Bemisia tabaci]|uniref:Ionotropic glutamate receptor C-terminal domain-containing protein n=1 Tax=Bemisia tabaci TaxID=7038 RepID=A0A9P0AF24_BEMTA|nr:unnamed protein product [Bemisia tabaci]